VPRRLHRAVVVAASLAAACQGGRRGPPPERFVPRDASAVLVVPEAGRAAKELADLHATVAGFPGAAELAAARGTLAAQLGFDPLDPEALADAGLDPRRGAAVATLEPKDAAARGSASSPRTEAGRSVLLVLPVGDAPKIEALFVRLARDRLGATERSAETRGEVSVVVLRAPGAPAPALAWAIVQHTAVLCAGAAGPAAVAAAAALAPDASLADAGPWKAARAALGPGAAAVQWVPPGSPLLARLWPFRDGVAVGVSAAAGRLTARAAMLLGDREPSFRALAADGAAAKLVSRLDPAAQLAARFDGDPATLGKKLVPILPAVERARLAAKGVDLERDVFGALAPGAAVSLSLSPRLDLAGLGVDALRADPLRAFEFEALLQVKDPAAAEATSARIAAAARGKRADGAWRIRTPSGEIAWRVDADERRVAAAGGRPGRLDALLARVEGGGWRPPTEAAGGALVGGLGGAILDPARLVAAVRALPEEAFGTGPSGFVMRSLVDRLVDPVSRLAAVSFRADLAEGALVLALEIEARRGQP
jgi:hypothetical protein